MVYDACYGLATVVASQVRKLLIKNGVQVGEVLLVAQDRLLKLVHGPVGAHLQGPLRGAEGLHNPCANE